MSDKVKITKASQKQTKLWWSSLFEYQEHALNSWQKISPFWVIPAFERFERNTINILQTDFQKTLAAIYNGTSMLMPWFVGSKTEPYIDIVEEDTRYKIFADLPGVDPEEIKIEYMEDSITIEGYRFCEKFNERKYIRNECCHGHFARTIAVSPDADLHRATAQIERSVLMIEVPKRLMGAEQSENPVTAVKIKAVS